MSKILKISGYYNLYSGIIIRVSGVRVPPPLPKFSLRFLFVDSLRKAALPHPCHTQGVFDMANIRKRGSKWQVQVRRVGHSSITKTFNRREEPVTWGRRQGYALMHQRVGSRYLSKRPLQSCWDGMWQIVLKFRYGKIIPSS